MGLNTAHPKVFSKPLLTEDLTGGINGLKKEYKNLILPIPRSGNYMRFDELVEMLTNEGVLEKTIEQIYDEIVKSKP